MNITPGIRHDLDNDTYHGLTDWLSSTQLKAALPERYQPGGSQAALTFGSLFHAVVLEPDTLTNVTVLDAAAIAGNNPKTGKPYDAPHMTARYKAAVAEAEQDGLTVVTREDWDKAHAMRDAVVAHPEAGPLIYHDDAAYEESAFAIDDNGVKHKARFDCRIPGRIVDLKSTAAKPGADSLTRTVIDYGYDVSAAHYLAVAELLDLDATAFTLVFVTKTAPYRVTVADLDDLLLYRGHDLRNTAIQRLTQVDAEPYEGATGRLTLTCPPWAFPTDYDDEMEIA